MMLLVLLALAGVTLGLIGWSLYSASNLGIPIL